MTDTLKAIAFAVLTVIAAYFLATVFGQIGGNWRVFLPLDILTYAGIGFFSARALGWRGALVVAPIAALVDGALGMGSLILPGAPHLSAGQIVRDLLLEFGLNVLMALAGATLGARFRAAV